MDLPAVYVALTEESLRLLSISHEMAHLWGGLLLYRLFASLPQARRLPALPFLAVALAELTNETLQAAYYKSLRLDDTIADIGWTLSLPALLLIGTLLLSPGLSGVRQNGRPALG